MKIIIKFKNIIKSNTGFNKFLYFGALPTIYKLGNNIKSHNTKVLSLGIGIPHIISDYKYKTWPFHPYNEDVTKNYPIWLSYLSVISSLFIIKKDVNKAFKIKPHKKKVV